MLVFVDKDGKYGFTDETGKIVINAVYDFALPFSEGFSVVCINGKMGIGQTVFINEAGQVAIDSNFYGARSFSEGLAQVEKIIDGQRKTGFINHQGELTIPLKYDFAMSFHNGLAPVCIGKSWVSGKYGCIDKTGKEVIPIKYNYLEPYANGQYIVKDGREWFLIDVFETVLSPGFQTQKLLLDFIQTRGPMQTL